MLETLETFEPFILTVHIIICLFLIVLILFQAGKGADMGAAFGAGSSQTLFGARGAATFLSKLTTGAAVIFLLTSISLAAIHRGRAGPAGDKSVVDEHADTQKVPEEVPLEKLVDQPKPETEDKAEKTPEN